MHAHLGKRLFITGIPTAGKSYLAQKLASLHGGISVDLDTLRERLASNTHYQNGQIFTAISMKKNISPR